MLAKENNCEMDKIERKTLIEDFKKTYLIGEEKGEDYILCLICNCRSYSKGDIEYRFCGRCADYHDDMYNKRTIPHNDIAEFKEKYKKEALKLVTVFRNGEKVPHNEWDLNNLDDINVCGYKEQTNEDD